MDELYEVINGLENVRAAFVVGGDINRASMKKALYDHHINLSTCGEQTLDHCYTTFRDGYNPLPHPAFGKADHVSILLLCAYKQRLKQVRPVVNSPSME